jgi:hypothetical protein
MDGISIILDIISAAGIVLYLLMTVSRIRELAANNYVGRFVEDIELRHAFTGVIAYFSAGFLNFAFTVNKTQADYLANPVWAATLYTIHLYFLVITLWIFVETVGDFVASGIEQRRIFGTDAQSTNDRELYGLFPPITLAVIVSLVLLVILHFITLLIVMGLVDGTSDTMHLLYVYGSVGMGIYYMIIFLLQYTRRQQRIMRLGRDIEFSHTFYGLFFFISAGTLYTVFTFGHVPADYAADPVLASNLNTIYTYYLIGSLFLMANGLLNIPAKGNEERRVSNLINST